jgi:hypothetical protein
LSQKVICDPVYNQIFLDRDKEKLILDLINCKEVQRLRRIRQLGVSYLTYPGADHTRFSHALGTMHLMKIALDYVKKNDCPKIIEEERLAALAAALLHDVGHGPFSHLSENLSGNKHDFWTDQIITSKETEINHTLKSIDRAFPKLIIDLLFHPPRKLSWINALLASQVDVDRMDYLLRDSYHCGVSCGQFDYHWIFHTLRIDKIDFERRKIFQPVWIEKATRAIEEYIFARYNMYWTVYYHRTTRGYEELLKIIFQRAADLIKKKIKFVIISNEMKKYILHKKLSVDEYLSLDDSTVIAQIMIWKNKSSDKILKDLCLRFLNRQGYKWVEYRENIDMHIDRQKAHDKIFKMLKNKGLDPKYYFIESKSAAIAYDYYHPEKAKKEQTPKNSIFILNKDEEKTELSQIRGMGRLKVITGVEQKKLYYYVPEEFRNQINKILDKMNK